MTWTYLEQCTCSREPEEVSSPTYCWDTDPCALLKSNPIADRYCSSDNGTASFPDSQSGTMSEHLTEPSGEDELMSCVPGGHARTYQPQERVQDLTGNKAVYSRRLSESLCKLNPKDFSWKTHQCSLGGGLEPFLASWPNWGIMQGGVCWAQIPLDFAIAENASGFLPTPSGTSNHGKNHVIGRLDEWGGSSNPFRKTSLGKVRCPNFEEWMMGWPVSWTGLMPLETDKFQQWLHLHGKS
jgi:hypothetical protein